jgi:hypothetical protein
MKSRRDALGWGQIRRWGAPAAIFFVLTVFVTLAWPTLAREVSTPEVKHDSLRELQAVRSENTKKLKDLDESLTKKIQDETTTEDVESAIEDLKKQKREYLMRQEFLDRLIFQIDTHFAGGDLRKFVGDTLVSMSVVDATSPAQADTSLAKFLKFAAEAVRHLPEQKENVIAFLEGYMNQSISHPIRWEDYVSTRNYTNGAKSETGRPIARDEVGAIADQRTQPPLVPKSTTTPAVTNLKN